jgi:ribosomal protein L11 methylase PrmA
MSVSHLFLRTTGDEVEDVLNVIDERGLYRNAFFDLKEELNSKILPKLVHLQNRLNFAYSSGARAEGDKLLLIIDQLELIINGGEL